MDFMSEEGFRLYVVIVVEVEDRDGSILLSGVW